VLLLLTLDGDPLPPDLDARGEHFPMLSPSDVDRSFREEVLHSNSRSHGQLSPPGSLTIQRSNPMTSESADRGNHLPPGTTRIALYHCQ